MAAPHAQRARRGRTRSFFHPRISSLRAGVTNFIHVSALAADAFSLTGDNSRNFGITTTSGTITNGTKTMNFTTAASSATGTTSSTGTYSFTVGGTLTVTGTETPGSYTGTYNATVTYQ